MYFYSFNSIVGSYDSAEANSIGEAIAIFSRPQYGIRRSTMKAVPVIHEAIIEAHRYASDEELDGLPVVGQADDWTVSAAGVLLPWTESSAMLANWLEALMKTDLRVHHNQEWEWEDGELTRDDWWVATPEWVANYHRSGGTWGYAD